MNPSLKTKADYPLRITKTHNDKQNASASKDRTIRMIAHQQVSHPFCGFTLREREILRLMAKGLTADMIGDQLFISPHTVKTHQKNMLKKSGCANSIHIVAESIRSGLIQ